MQCLEWGNVKRPDWQPIPVALEGLDGLKATALVLKRSLPRTGRSILYVPRGPILDWNDEATVSALVKKLRHMARAHRAILIKVDPAVPSSTHGVAQTLEQLGFRPSPDASGGFGGTQPRCVMKLDIAGSEEDVQARFHTKWRYNIRLAAKKGVTVKSECTHEDLVAFHALYRVTAERDGFTGRPLSYFQKMLDVLGERGLAKLFITYLGDKPLSGAICFLLPPQCWYVYGASSNEHRNVMPNHAMQWAMMQWGARKRLFDL
jgi:lipid II:glycine glycyltransferase (peptidoglycan interpeptide bridge formation enzyme)